MRWSEPIIFNRAVHNYSSSFIQSHILDLLGLGLRFIPHTPFPPRHTIESALNDYTRQARLLYVNFKPNRNKTFVKEFYLPNPEYQPPKAPPQIEYNLSKIDYEISLRFDRLAKLNSKVKTKVTSTLKTLSDLRERKDIRVVASDKNLGPVILDNDTYVSMALEHLLDTSTYTHCQGCKETLFTTIQQQWSRLATLIRNSRTFGNITNIGKFLDNAATKTTIPPFHVIAKIHKTPLKGRPIAGAVNWLTTGASQLLAYALKPVVNNMPFILRDSKALIVPLENLNVPQDAFLFTMDITALYPNMKQYLTINAVRNLQHVDKILLTNLTNYVLRNSYVEFGEAIFKQKEGMAMGTNAAVQLANLYVDALIESQPWFKQELTRHLVFYRRYIDDVFGIWTGSLGELDTFVARMNTVDDKLKFTVNVDHTTVEFLDLLISLAKGKIRIATHQKVLNKYLYIPATSQHPPATKRGFIKGELIRYARNSTLYTDYLTISNKFHMRLLRRGHARTFINPLFTFNHWEQRKVYLSIDNTRQTDTTTTTTETTRTPRKLFFKFPFHNNTRSLQIGQVCNDESRRFTFPSAIPFPQTIVAYRAERNLGSHLLRSTIDRIRVQHAIQTLYYDDSEHTADNTDTSTRSTTNQHVHDQDTRE
jgi:hypothetical protein